MDNTREFNILTDMPRFTWITYCDIKLKLGDDAVLLYIEFLRMANEQKTNQPWATNSFMKQNLGWSLKRIKKARACLIESGYLVTIPPVWNKKEQKFNKNYTKVNKIITAKKLLKSALLTGSLEEPVSAGSSEGLVAEKTHKCLKDNDISIDYLKDNDKRESTGNTTFPLSKEDRVDITGRENIPMTATAILPHIEQSEIDLENAVTKLRDLALTRSKQYGRSLHGSRGSELVKFLKRKVKILTKNGDSLKDAETAIEIAINSYYGNWIKDDIDGDRREKFGLVKTLEEQWKILTS